MSEYTPFGTIRLFLQNVVPPGWQPCDGGPVHERVHPEAFRAIFGLPLTTPEDQFRVPDLTAPAPGVRYLICLRGPFPTSVPAGGYIGEVRLYPKAGLPKDVLPCDGGEFSLHKYQALGSLIFDRFGTRHPTLGWLPKLTAPQPDLVYAISRDGEYPQEDDYPQEPDFLGVIALFAVRHQNIPSRSFARCNGTTFRAEFNNYLPSILGRTFGGDGVQTFGTPALSAPAENLEYYLTTNGIFPRPDY